jgi:hypothetical protein
MYKFRKLVKMESENPPPAANILGKEILATKMSVGHDFRHALLVVQNKLPPAVKVKLRPWLFTK